MPEPQDLVYDPYDFWALSRFADVLGASLDHETFRSGRGTVLELIDKLNEPTPMISKDPPEHTRLRKLVSRAFSPRRIAELEERVRGIARSYLEPRVGSGGFDYVADFGARLPVMVISSMPGIPEEDREQVRLWTDATLHREPGVTLPEPGVMRELFGYLARYVGERREAPRDDMMSDLLEAEIREPDGATRRLTNVEILTFISLLSAAGNETVARLEGRVALEETLLRFPEWEVDRDATEMVHTSTVRGWEKVPIHF